MDSLYTKIAKNVFDKYLEANLVKPERRKEVIETCVKQLSSLNIKVKIVPNEKKDSTSTKSPFVCAFQLVKSGTPTKTCGKPVKSSDSLYCVRHFNSASCETPAKYLSIRFPNYKEKCIDVTNEVRGTKGINLHLNSTASVYSMYIIRNATPEYHAVYYGENHKLLGWKHVLLGCLSIKRKNEFEVNNDILTGISLANRVPVCDVTLGLRVRENLKVLRDISTEKMMKNETKQSEKE